MNKLKIIVGIVLVLMFLVGVNSVLGTNLGKVSTSSKDVEIEFLDDIILEEKNENKTLEDFFSKIKLESGKVSIDSDEFPEITDKKAKLTFKLKNYNNPILCHNGVCSFEYKITKEGNKKYSAIVNKWSSWTINDSTWNGTFLNTTLFGNNLGLSYLSTLSYNFNNSNISMIVAYDWSFRGFNATTYNSSTMPQWNGNSLRCDGYDDWFTTNKVKHQLWSVTPYNNTITVRFTPHGAPYKNSSVYNLPAVFGDSTGSREITVGNYTGSGGGNKIWFYNYNQGTTPTLIIGTPYTPEVETTITIIQNDTWVQMYKDVVQVANGTVNNSQGATGEVTFCKGWAPSTARANVSISKVVLLPGSFPVNPTYISNLATTNSTLKHYLSGQYISEIYNSSDYDSAIETQKWLALALYGQNATGVTEAVMGRAGDCATLNSVNYTDGVAANGSYSFPAIQGTCFQYALTWLGDGFSTPLISNVTVQSFKVKKPAVQNLTIFPAIANFTTTIYGNATFILNDTDSGQIWFRLYINGVLNKTFVYNATGNGSVVMANFSSGYQHNKVLYFTATSIINTTYGSSTGDAVQSSNITMGNINFTIITISPGILNITAQEYNTYPFTVEKPNIYPFSITLNDFDGDVNITWSVNNVNISVGNNFNYESQIYPIGLNIVRAYASDGEYNATVVWTVNTIFAVGLTDIEKTLLGGVVILGIVCCVLVGFTDLNWKKVITYLVGAFILMVALVFLNMNGII